MNPFSFRSLNYFIAFVLQRYICFKGIQGGIRKQTVYMLPLVYKNSFIDILHEFGKKHEKGNGTIIILLMAFILKLYCLNIIISLIFR